jgi:hypothetical protein
MKRANGLEIGSFVVAIVAAGAGAGCGSDPPPPPAHSSSFFPVRGTTDSGAAASVFEWSYRVNGGAAVPLSTLPGALVTFADEEVRITGTSAVTTLHGTLAGDSTTPGLSGSLSTVTTDHLTTDVPVTETSRDVDTSSSLNVAGAGGSGSRVVLHYTYSVPMPTFFDRDDLDTVAPGTSDTVTLTANATGTATVTGASGGNTQTVTETIAETASWTMVGAMPSLQVLGQDYSNVVQVQTTISATESSTGMTTQTVTTSWLAKGIGFIRQTGTITQPTGGTDDVNIDLVSTNLVVP